MDVGGSQKIRCNLLTHNKRVIMKYISSVFAFLLSVSAYATPYSLEDYTVDAYMERTIETGYGLGRISGFGLDSPFVVHTGSDDKKKYNDVFTLDVNDNNFSINFLKKTGWVDGIVFRLIQPDYETTTLENFWSNVDVDTNIEGLKFNNGPGWVELNLGNIRFTEQSYFTAHFNSKNVAVPEPLPIGLLLLGLFTLYFRGFRLNR